MTTRTCAADVEALRAYAEGVGDLAFGLQGDAHALGAALMHLGRTRSEGLPPLPLLADDVAELAGDMIRVANDAGRTAAAFDEAGGTAVLSWLTDPIDRGLSMAGLYDEVADPSTSTWGARVRGALGPATAAWVFQDAVREQWQIDTCAESSSARRVARAVVSGTIVSGAETIGSSIGGGIGGFTGARVPLPPWGKVGATLAGTVGGGAYAGPRAEQAGRRHRNRVLGNEPTGSCASPAGAATRP